LLTPPVYRPRSGPFDSGAALPAERPPKNPFILKPELKLSVNQKIDIPASCEASSGRRIITPGLLETTMRILKMATIGVVLVTAGSVRISSGQMLPAPSQEPVIMQQQRAEQQKMRIAERQKQLVADTDKLLSLTTALKEQVNESNKDVLSLDMIKKAEEIEKLAHSVKERIKG
jgi:hypothetical protein